MPLTLQPDSCESRGWRTHRPVETKKLYRSSDGLYIESCDRCFNRLVILHGPLYETVLPTGSQCRDCAHRLISETCRSERCPKHCLEFCRCQFVVLNRAYSPATDTILTPKDRIVFKSSRYVGVEWEYNGIFDGEPLNNFIKKWNAGHHRDGSCGWEVVTSPQAGDNIRKCLMELSTAFETGEASIDDRCGIHVHVDARDFGWFDIYKLIKLYAKLEPALYVLAGPTRVENSYAKPCGAQYLQALNAPDIRNALTTVIIGAAGGRVRLRSPLDKKSGGRYRGLNLMPWLAGRRTVLLQERAHAGSKARKRGANRRSDCTVEFRLHGNSSDGSRVANWAELCASIVDHAMNLSEKEIQALPNTQEDTLVAITPHIEDYIRNTLKEYRNVPIGNRMMKYKRGSGDFIIGPVPGE